MAKKSFSKVTAFIVEIKSDSANTSMMTIKGNNSKGTEVEIKVKMDDYEFPGMVQQMAAIGKRRVQSATDLSKRIINSVND